MNIPIRVLVAKPGLDGHDRDAKVIALCSSRRRHGSNLRRCPANVGDDRHAALQEDVQVIGLSIPTRAHKAIMPRMMELLRQKEMTDVLMIVGGIIPEENARELKKHGVAEVFQPGASLEKIVAFTSESVQQIA